LVLDTQFRDAEGGIRKIQHALDNGWKVRIFYVQRPFDLVASGAISRAQEEGRWGSVRELPKIHRDVQAGIARIAEHFKDEPMVEIRYLLNEGTPENPKPIKKLDLADIQPGGEWYHESEEVLNEEVERALQQARAAGEVPGWLLDALEGRIEPSAFPPREAVQELGQDPGRVRDEAAGGQAPPPRGDLSAGPFAVAPPVESEAFRRWFGDSKVVDENGSPAVFFHGTGAAARLTEFDPAFAGMGNMQYGPGFYFTDNPETASGYTNRRLADGSEKPGGEDSPGVLPVYLSLQNPLIVDAGDVSNLSEALHLTRAQAIEIAKAAPNIRNAEDGPLVDWFPLEPGQKITDSMIRQVAKNYESPDMLFGDLYQGQDAGAFLDALSKATGYDGLIVTFDTGERHAVAWRPTQVKSIFNRGTFSTGDRDIRFAVRDDQPELPGATPAQTRITPEGRPDLANPGRTEPVRGFVSAVDELRNRAGQPEPTTFDAIEQEAARRMSRDYDGEVYRAKQKVQRGEALTAEETVILAESTNRQAQRALRTESEADLTEAVRTAWQYRQSGTIAARALGIRRDRVAGPKQRYREAMMNALLLPSPKVRQKLQRIADKLADPETSPEQRQKLEERQESLFDREGRKAGKIREDLARQGYDPRLITEDTMADPTWATGVIDTARRARTEITDSLYWVWMNSILSGPLTHAANIVGNFANMAYRMGMLRTVEGAIGSATRAEDVPTLSEQMFLAGRLGQTLSAGWSAMVQSWATNRQVFDEQIIGADPSGQLQLDFGINVKGEELRLPDAGPRSRILRTLGLGGLPLKLLMAEDQFFKTVAGTIDANGRAYRQAKKEGLSGEAVVARVDELLEDWGNPIWQNALEEAKVVVFQDDPSPLGRAAKTLRKEIPTARYFLPFINTPDRLFVRGIELTPLGVLMGGVDVVGGLKSRDTKRAIRGAATGIMAAGLFLAMLAVMDDDEGQPVITGSKVRNWRDAAEQYRTAPPQSIRIGGKWYSYARIEPLSTGLAVVVDIVQQGLETGDWTAAGTEAWKSLLAVAEDKTFLRTVGEVLEALRDPERAEGLISGTARRTFVTAWVPNLFKQTVRALDSNIRDTRPPLDAGWWDEQTARVPYEALPVSALGEAPMYDLWGRPITRGSPFGDDGALAALYRLSVPIAVSDAEMHPVDRLVARYNQRVRDGQLGDTTGEDGHDQDGEFHPRPPARYFYDGGEKIDLTADEYQGMIRDAGQRASERLLAMSLNYDEPRKADVRRIRRVFREEYDRAKREIMQRRGR